MEQLDGILAAGAPTLDDDVLDRIDELVPPGTDVSAADGGWIAAVDRAGLAPPASPRSSASEGFAESEGLVRGPPARNPPVR